MQEQDLRTGQGGFVQQQVYVDPATNCLFTVDPITGQYLWLIDPTTGRPMVNPAGIKQVQPDFVQPEAAQFDFGQPAAEQPEFGRPISAQTDFGRPPAVQLQSFGAEIALNQTPSDDTSTAFMPRGAAGPSELYNQLAVQPAAAPPAASAVEPAMPAHAPDPAVAAQTEPERANNPAETVLFGPTPFADVPKKRQGRGPLIAGAIAAVAVMALIVALLFVVPGILGSSPAQQAARPSQAQESAQSQSSEQLPEGEQERAATQVPDDSESLPVGQAADVGNGLSVTLNSVDETLANYDGSPVTCLNVTYTNTGAKEEQFNVFDWKAQDESGVLRSFTFYSKATEELNSGTVAAGESVTGNIYFEGNNLVKAYYFRSIVQTESEIVWSIQ